MPDRTPTPPSARPSKDARRDAAREKARLMRELEAKKKRRNRVMVVTAAIVVAVLAIGGVALGVAKARENAAAASATPAGVTDAGAVVTGDKSAPHSVAIYLDYQCPYCKAFDASVGPWLEEQRDAGVTTIEYHPISFLDRASTTRYSSRSASAAFCVAGDSGADFTKFTDAMYAQQPEEGGDGLTDSKIIGIAESAGASNIGSCVADEKYSGFVKKVTDTAMSTTADGGVGVTGTPTIFVDGKVVQSANQGVPSQEDIAAALGVTDSSTAGSSPTADASTSASNG